MSAIDVLFDFQTKKPKDAVVSLSKEGNRGNAYLGKVWKTEIRVPQRVAQSNVVLSGLFTLFELTGSWQLYLDCDGRLYEINDELSGENTIYVKADAPAMFVELDGGQASTEMILDAVLSMEEKLELSGSVGTILEVSEYVPLTVYFRPPLSYYAEYLLSGMDDDDLAALGYRLIE